MIDMHLDRTPIVTKEVARRTRDEVQRHVVHQNVTLSWSMRFHAVLAVFCTRQSVALFVSTVRVRATTILVQRECGAPKERQT